MLRRANIARYRWKSGNDVSSSAVLSSATEASGLEELAEGWRRSEEAEGGAGSIEVYILM
jgi:hypothetical protein